MFRYGWKSLLKDVAGTITYNFPPSAGTLVSGHGLPEVSTGSVSTAYIHFKDEDAARLAAETFSKAIEVCGGKSERDKQQVRIGIGEFLKRPSLSRTCSGGRRETARASIGAATKG